MSDASHHVSFLESDDKRLNSPSPARALSPSAGEETGLRRSDSTGARMQGKGGDYSVTLHNNEIIDQSQSHDTEKVVEVSPEPGRFVRLNTLLGKGAYKVVYKALDRSEGYEVAWNTMQVNQA